MPIKTLNSFKYTSKQPWNTGSRYLEMGSYHNTKHTLEKNLRGSFYLSQQTEEPSGYTNFLHLRGTNWRALLTSAIILAEK